MGKSNKVESITPSIRLTDEEQVEWNQFMRKGIREMKVVAKQHGVKGFSKMTLAQLCDRVMEKRLGDRAEAEEEAAAEERREAGNLTPEERAKASDRGAQARARNERKAYRAVAEAADARQSAEDELKVVRKDCNQEVKETKAAFIEAYEMGVDYDDPNSVREKLDSMTERWADHDDACGRRIELLKPLRDALRDAKKRLRTAVQDARQLKLEW